MFGVLRRVGSSLRTSACSLLSPRHSLTPSLVPSLTVLARGMANHRHRKVLKLAKGYRGRANRCFTVAKQRVDKARQYAYVGRKVSV
jgi:hypothetical protein